MKRLLFLTVLFPSILFSQNNILWDFLIDNQGWEGLGGDRDVSVSWNDGALEMDYIDGGNSSTQLWFPQIRVENVSYNSSDHLYLKIDYEAVNWPTTDPVTVLLSLDAASSNRGTFSLDPAKNSKTIAIASAINESGVYDGEYNYLQLELPRSLATYTASDWFDASTRITKIELLNEPNNNATEIIWNFDTGTEGWEPYGSDATVSHDGSGNIVVSYNNTDANFDYPAITVDLSSSPIDASLIDTFYMKYEVFNWPEEYQTVLMNVQFNTDVGAKYAPVNFVAADGFLKFDIRNDLVADWGILPEDCNISRIRIELPHNSAAGQANFSKWENASINIDYVMLKDASEDVPEPPVSDETTSWTFDTDLDGWYTSEDLDVDLTWEDSALVINYVDNAHQGTQVWFPQIYRNTTINAADYKYCNIHYEAIDWPVRNSVLALLFLDKADGKRTYSNLDFDPDASWLSIDIKKLHNSAWSQTDYTGEFKKVGFELPHNSVATPGTDWYGIAKLKITKIEFSNTYIPPPVTDSITAYWSFDTDFSDSKNNIVGIETGTPLISNSDEALIGDGALKLDDGSYLTMPENEVFAREETSFMFWAKTPDISLNEGEKATILSFKDVDFKLSVSNDKLLFETGGTSVSLADWENNVWNHIALYINSNNQLTCTFNGIDCEKTISTNLSDRQNDLIVGSNNLSAIIDELTVFNYLPYVSRIEIDQLRKTPPSVNDTIPAYSASWDQLLEQSALNKSGLTRLRNPKFMFQPIGLGGTVLRADPWGFAFNKNPNNIYTSPYFGYEYWWDNSGHRLNAFNVRGGYEYSSPRYGDVYEPGSITSFEQNLDIRTGILETALTLDIDNTTFTTERETFVTPDGILVIRVKDSGAPYPLQLGIEVNKDINWGGTYYQGDEEQYARDDANSTARNIDNNLAGAVLVAKRTNSATAALAVAVETSSGTVTFDNYKFGSSDKDATITFYIAPESSFNPATPDSPWDHAWNAANAAMQTGFDDLKQQTTDWWGEFMNISSVSVPDKKVSELYAQSLYYHGVYFGNTAIPPGCFGTEVNGFFGGVCPEYDLCFSSFALAYTGHINETKNIAQWVVDVLPTAKKQAVEGVTHHDVTRQYPTYASGDSGAIYTTIMGYDGTLTIQGEPFEGINLLQNYPGINSARMALNYLDYSDDQSFADDAHEVLSATTYVAIKDLIYDNSKEGYRDEKIPNCMQQAAVQMGFNECKKRGVAEQEWIDNYDGKILFSEGLLKDEPILSAAVGYNPSIGEGSGTAFFALWWATVINKHDPRAIKAVDNYHETFQSYIFNNGWTGVHNAKIYRGNNALMWLRNFQRTDVIIDETVFSETTNAIWTTPAIAAHGAYMCNLTQMLIDPDNDTVVDVFPAVPDEWEYKQIGFEGLMTSGALSFTASRNIDGVKVVIENKANTERNRKVRIKIPDFLSVVGADELNIIDGFIEKEVTIASGDKEVLEYSFAVELIGVGTRDKAIDESINDNTVHIYPNPTHTGTVNIVGVNNIKRADIYSMTGKLVLSSNTRTNSIDVSILKKGVYVLRLSADSNIYSKLLVVE